MTTRNQIPQPWRTVAYEVIDDCIETVYHSGIRGSFFDSHNVEYYDGDFVRLMQPGVFPPPELCTSGS